MLLTYIWRGAADVFPVEVGARVEEQSQFALGVGPATETGQPFAFVIVLPVHPFDLVLNLLLVATAMGAVVIEDVERPIAVQAGLFKVGPTVSAILLAGRADRRCIVVDVFAVGAGQSRVRVAGGDFQVDLGVFVHRRIIAVAAYRFVNRRRPLTPDSLANQLPALPTPGQPLTGGHRLKRQARPATGTA